MSASASASYEFDDEVDDAIDDAIASYDNWSPRNKNDAVEVAIHEALASYGARSSLTDSETDASDGDSDEDE